jgi:hypothetical protein
LARDGAALDGPAWEGRWDLAGTEMVVMPGRQLGRCKIEKIIGRGQGEVYQPLDTRLGRTVAIAFERDCWILQRAEVNERIKGLELRR